MEHQIRDIDEAKGDKLENCRWLQAESKKNGTAWEGSGHLICKLTDVTQKELTGQRHTEGDPYCRKLLAFRAQSKVVSSHPCWASFWDGCPYAPASKICQSLFFPRSCNVGSTKTSFFKKLFVVQHVCTPLNHKNSKFPSFCWCQMQKVSKT